MARKTYHHLVVGQTVPVQFWYWTLTEGFDVIKVTAEASVAQVSNKTLVATVPVTIKWDDNIKDFLVTNVPEAVTFSRQGGQEWGSNECGWRLNPSLAQKK